MRKTERGEPPRLEWDLTRPLSRPSGENTDSSTRPGGARLTREEEALLAALLNRFEKLVCSSTWATLVERYDVDALVQSGFGGMLAGRALLDVLTGRVSPSGRLADTWPARYASNPVSSQAETGTISVLPGRGDKTLGRQGKVRLIESSHPFSHRLASFA